MFLYRETAVMRSGLFSLNRAWNGDYKTRAPIYFRCCEQKFCRWGWKDILDCYSGFVLRNIFLSMRIPSKDACDPPAPMHFSFCEHIFSKLAWKDVLIHSVNLYFYLFNLVCSILVLIMFELFFSLEIVFIS
jgi:hypothetical protein